MEYLTELEPDRAITFAYYGKILSNAGEYDRAIDAFAKSLDLNPDDVITLNEYAKTLIRVSQYEYAVLLYERSLEIEPNDIITLTSCAYSLSQLDRNIEALNILKCALKINSRDVIALNLSAVILTRIRSYREAYSYFERSLAANPNNPKTLSLYGRTLMYNGHYEYACLQFDRSLALRTNNYTLFLYARVLEELREYREAIVQLEQVNLDRIPQYHANVVRITLGRLYYAVNERDLGLCYFDEALEGSTDKEKTLLYSARSILATNPYSPEAVEMLQKIKEDSPRYAEAYEMLTLNLDDKSLFEMLLIDTEADTSDTEMLNRALYHKIANEIGILKSIAYRILRSRDDDKLLDRILEDIERISTEIKQRRDAQQAEIEEIPSDDYERIIQIISRTAHDISDLVNNQLATVESKTRRAMRKIDGSDPNYHKFEKLLNQLEFTQNALNDLKAINEGIQIRNNRFKVRDLFEKWMESPKLENASISLDIQNGDSEFDGDEEKIKSILNELVENSIKHNADEPDLNIKISSEDIVNPEGVRGMTIPGEQTYLSIQFQDNGKGVPDEKKSWIFQPLKTTSEEGKGSGLGLFIIRKTLAKMQGYIRETGTNGANFEIYIPYLTSEV